MPALLPGIERFFAHDPLFAPLSVFDRSRAMSSVPYEEYKAGQTAFCTYARYVAVAVVLV